MEYENNSSRLLELMRIRWSIRTVVSVREQTFFRDVFAAHCGHCSRDRTRSGVSPLCKYLSEGEDNLRPEDANAEFEDQKGDEHDRLSLDETTCFISEDEHQCVYIG